jgi:hypothetical protein
MTMLQMMELADPASSLLWNICGWMGSEMRKKPGGRIYCVEDEMSKTMLISRLLVELGELRS